MVNPHKIALVVRQRGGGNLMVHTRGISARDAGLASEEVVSVLGRYAQAKGGGDIDGSGDNAPRFSSDRLIVGNGRYMAVHRLVSKVWIIAIVYPHTNPFIAVRVVDSATKALVSACQQVEVTKEVLAKHWVESYLLLAAVLSQRGTNFEKAQVEAAAQYLTIAADAKDRKRSPTEQKKLGSKSVSRPEQPKQKLSTMDSISAKLSFTLPSEVQQERSSVANSQISSQAFDTFAENANTREQTLDMGDLMWQVVQQQGKVQQEAGQNQDPFAGLPSLIPETQQPAGSTGIDDLFAGFSETQTTQNGVQSPPMQQTFQTSVSKFQPGFFDDLWEKSNAFEPTSEAPETSSLPVPGTMSSFQQTTFDKLWGSNETGTASARSWKAQEAPSFPVVKGPLLLLVETWKGQFNGSNLSGATVEGEVIWGHQSIPANLSTAKFRLVRPPSGDIVVEESLRDARIYRRLSPGPVGSAVLKYRLPPGTLATPLLLRLTTGMQPGFGKLQGQEGVVVLLVEYVMSEKWESKMQGFIDVHIPEKLGVPSLVRPRPEWSRQQRRLRWRLSSKSPRSCVFRAAFGHDRGMDSLAAAGFVGGHKAAAAGNVWVEAHLMGGPGFTLSGVMLEQEKSGMVGMQALQESCAWKAHVVAKP